MTNSTTSIVTPLLAGVTAIMVALSGWLVSEILEGQRELERVQRAYRQKLYDEIKAANEKQIELERFFNDQLRITRNAIAQIDKSKDSVLDRLVRLESLYVFQRDVILQILKRDCKNDSGAKNGNSGSVAEPTIKQTWNHGLGGDVWYCDFSPPLGDGGCCYRIAHFPL